MLLFFHFRLFRSLFVFLRPDTVCLDLYYGDLLCVFSFHSLVVREIFANSEHVL